LKVLKRIYGRTTTRLLTNLKVLHEDIPALILEGAYGGIIGRPGLTLRERKIVNVVVLTIRKLHSQLYSHLRGAVRIGVDSKTLAEVIRLATRISGTERSHALTILSNLQPG
jgi:4-carboxymuconolactone decarboxylase